MGPLTPLHRLPRLTPAALLAALALLSATCSAQADAQPPAAASAAGIDSATLPASYQAALAAMHAHDWPRARQLLQQTLAEQPHLAGAWLDLALVAWQQGQNAEALEFLADLEDGFAPLPPPIAQAVATLRQRIRATPLTLPPTPEAPAQAVASADSAGYLALGLGHDSNANVGLRADAIRLTLPGGQVNLPLAPSSRQRAAPFAYAALQRTGVSAMQERPIAWLWSLQTRQPSRIHGYSTAEAQAEAATPVGSGAQSPLLGLRLHSAWVGGRLAYLAPGLYTLQRWRTASISAARSSSDDATPPLALPRTCQWEQRTQLDSKNYPRARNLASWGASYRLAWDCASSAQGPSSAWLGQVEASWDAPHHRASRPGGNTWQTSLQLGRRIPNPWALAGHQLTLGAEWAHIQDTAAYSPWLENGARRLVRRMGWQIEWQPPPLSATTPSAWRWAVQLQSYRQRSNLSLFELRSTTVQLLTTRPW